MRTAEMATAADRVFIIAEAGVNHGGSPERANAMVEAAAAAGADAVKFQTFRAERLASGRAAKAPYQTRTTAGSETQLDMLKRLELSADTHRRLVGRAEELGLEFLSTPFDEESLGFLVIGCGVRRLKVSSGDITNGPLLLAAAKTGLPVILSTGMSTLGDIELALSVLAFGYAGSEASPGRDSFSRAYASKEGRRLLAEKATLLQCASEYPAPAAEANLGAMDTLATAFSLTVGYSDHTRGINIALAAAARGAQVIEKHFTLDRTASGPDHAASLEPDELAAMIEGIREIEAALGDGRKVPTASERGNMTAARKSLVAARPIRSGQEFSPATITVKRPGDGLSPMDYWDLIGKTADRDFAQDEPVTA